MDLRKNRYISRRIKNEGEFLKKSYKELTTYLNKKFAEESVTTQKEDEFYRIFSSRTGLKIHRSFWIGKRNYDFFVGNVCGRFPSKHEKQMKKAFTGFVIEIDGDIHNQYRKMLRDETKFDLLLKLNIGFQTIENHDLRHPSVISLINHIPDLKRLDTRARRRLYRNIYLETLLAHKDLIVTENLVLSKAFLELLRKDWTV